MEDTITQPSHPEERVLLPSINDLLKRSKDLVLQRPGLFLGLSFIPAFFQLAGELLLVSDPAAILSFGILVAISILTSILTGIAIVKALAMQEMGNIKEALLQSLPHFFNVFLTGILVAIVTVIGFILLIIPGLYLTIALGFYMYAIVLDQKSGWGAAEFSKELVRGNWWAVCGRMLALGLIIGLVIGLFGAIIEFITAIPLVIALFNFLVSLLVTPFVLAYSYLIYQSLKTKLSKSAVV